MKPTHLRVPVLPSEGASASQVLHGRAGHSRQQWRGRGHRASQAEPPKTKRPGFSSESLVSELLCFFPLPPLLAGGAASSPAVLQSGWTGSSVSYCPPAFLVLSAREAGPFSRSKAVLRQKGGRRLARAGETEPTLRTKASSLSPSSLEPQSFYPSSGSRPGLSPLVAKEPVLSPQALAAGEVSTRLQCLGRSSL